MGLIVWKRFYLCYYFRLSVSNGHRFFLRYFLKNIATIFQIIAIHDFAIFFTFSKSLRYCTLRYFQYLRKVCNIKFAILNIAKTENDINIIPIIYILYPPFSQKVCYVWLCNIFQIFKKLAIFDFAIFFISTKSLRYLVCDI